MVLGFFVLALGRDARGQVGDPHGRAGGVDALAAGAAGAKNVHADVRFFDIQLDVVARVGDYVHRSKGCMPSARGIKGRNANQAVDAPFAFEKAESVRPGDAQSNAFDARLVAGQKVQLLHRIVAACSPAGVHAQEHFGPVLRFRTARSGMYFQNGVLAVFLAGKQHDQFGFVQQAGQLGALLVQGFQGFRVFAFRCQGQPFNHVVVAGFELAKAFHLILQAAFFLQQGRQGFGFVPRAGPGKALFDFLQALFTAGQVKDAPRGR